jgi:acetyltransferase-like isoleucine patch superfamily enzyme
MSRVANGRQTSRVERVRRRERYGAHRSARVVTWQSARWVLRHRAWTPWYLVRYWRFLLLRLRHARHGNLVTAGMVFLGKGVKVEVRPGHARLVLGRWVHLGDGNRLMVHEGTLRIGDKTVLGHDNTITCYLDVDIGPRTLVADWVYICDFDHRTDDITVAIKDQGIVKAPVRVAGDCWMGTKVSVLRGADIGTGTVLAAHSVVRGLVPDYAVVGGAPARVLKDRRAVYEADAARRAALADIAAKTDRAARQSRASA